VKPSSHVCRDAIDACDAAEQCDGATKSCPADGVKPSSHVCRDATDVCDHAETCDGVYKTCPADVVKTNTITCRDATGACDQSEQCDGMNKACPVDAVKPTTHTCRDATGVCDQSEQCDGVGKLCPVDAVKPPTHTCREADGVCDAAEQCDGATKSCPADGVKPSSHVCRATSSCDYVPERCDGVAKSCPPDVRNDYSYTYKCGTDCFFCGFVDPTAPLQGNDKSGVWAPGKVMYVGKEQSGCHNNAKCGSYISLPYPRCLSECPAGRCPLGTTGKQNAMSHFIDLKCANNITSCYAKNDGTDNIASQGFCPFWVDMATTASLVGSGRTPFQFPAPPVDQQKKAGRGNQQEGYAAPAQKEAAQTTQGLSSEAENNATNDHCGTGCLASLALSCGAFVVVAGVGVMVFVHQRQMRQKGQMRTDSTVALESSPRHGVFSSPRREGTKPV